MYKLKMYYAKTLDESPMPNKKNLVKKENKRKRLMHNAARDQRARNIDNVGKEENAQVTHESNTPNPALRLYTNTKETNNRKDSFKTT
jgi:polysaccharide pyruvyl transferase WcaK-like protein